MPVCEICENEVSDVFSCKHCGARFCEKCGDSERLLCEDCIDYMGVTAEEGEVTSD